MKMDSELKEMWVSEGPENAGCPCSEGRLTPKECEVLELKKITRVKEMIEYYTKARTSTRSLELTVQLDSAVRLAALLLTKSNHKGDGTMLKASMEALINVIRFLSGFENNLKTVKSDPEVQNAAEKLIRSTLNLIAPIWQQDLKNLEYAESIISLLQASCILDRTFRRVLVDKTDAIQWVFQHGMLSLTKNYSKTNRSSQILYRLCSFVCIVMLADKDISDRTSEQQESASLECAESVYASTVQGFESVLAEMEPSSDLTLIYSVLANLAYRSVRWEKQLGGSKIICDSLASTLSLLQEKRMQAQTRFNLATNESDRGTMVEFILTAYLAIGNLMGNSKETRVYFSSKPGFLSTLEAWAVHCVSKFHSLIKDGKKAAKGKNIVGLTGSFETWIECWNSIVNISVLIGVENSAVKPLVGRALFPSFARMFEFLEDARETDLIAETYDLIFTAIANLSYNCVQNKTAFSRNNVFTKYVSLQLRNLLDRGEMEDETSSFLATLSALINVSYGNANVDLSYHANNYGELIDCTCRLDTLVSILNTATQEMNQDVTVYTCWAIANLAHCNSANATALYGLNIVDALDGILLQSMWMTDAEVVDRVCFAALEIAQRSPDAFDDMKADEFHLQFDEVETPKLTLLKLMLSGPYKSAERRKGENDIIQAGLASALDVD